MHILLPPSEGKTAGGFGPWTGDGGPFDLAEARSIVADAVRRNTPRGAIEPFGGCLPAHQRYSGVVWQHLDPESLDPAAQRRASEKVLVASGLGGVFAWDEPVPYYKLKMSASTPATGRLSTFWSTRLTALISDAPVIDLLALEQSAAFPVPRSHNGWVRVELLGPSGERAGHHGKAAKGRLARALLSTDDPLGLLDGYQDPEGWALRLEHR